MQKKLKFFFNHDKTFFCMTLLAIISSVAEVILEGKVSYNVSAVCTALVTAYCITLYISYKRHDKNVMKPAIGGLLTICFVRASDLLYRVLTNESTPTYSLIIVIVLFLCYLFILINHFVINSSHRSNPNKVMANQIVMFILILLTLTRQIDITLQTHNIHAFLSYVADYFVVGCVVCVESRLDAYRMNREAAGWTEESGYPKEYIHEYEKNHK